MKNTLIIFIAILISSCGSSSSTPNLGGLLPDATGGSDEVMLFLDDALVNDSLVKDIKKNMTDAYKVLPQPEARFSYATVAYGKANAILKRFRNPIYILVKNEKSVLANDILPSLSEEEKAKLKNQKDALIFKKNMWSADQNIAIVVAPNKNEILSTLLKYKSKLNHYFDKENLVYFKNIAYLDGVNQSLNKQFKEYHGIQFDVPKGYVLAKNEKNMVLLRKEDNKSTLFLGFDIVNYSDTIPHNNLGIERFNALGKYIEGETEGSFVVADSTLGFKSQKNIENGLVNYENAGLWVMENDFVGGGPFINQYIIDNKRNRVIYLQGLIYGPGEKKKKKYMRQFEAIFNSLEIID